jgi:hypothetical protein
MLISLNNFKCNPTWPEIIEKLQPNETAYDRFDICHEVFRKKLLVFIKKLNKFNKFVKYLKIIEYQHRDLSCAHIIIKFNDNSIGNN